MEQESLLPHSQEPATWPILSQINPIHVPSHLSLIHFNIILSWVFQVVSSLRVSPPKPCMLFSSAPYVLHALPISDMWNYIIVLDKAVIILSDW
jgi:hypothetical protein